MTMSEAYAPARLRIHLIVLMTIALLVAGLATASAAPAAVTVDLRVEGLHTTQFNGTVTTDARSVPGSTDTPACRANAEPAAFSVPNSITAVADALPGVATSGTFYGWGTMLCTANGEGPADANAGWLVRINQQDSTAPNGYVTATDPLSNGDSVIVYMSPTYGYFSASLDLRLPATAKPGQPVTGYVNSFDTATDARSPGIGATIVGAGGTASSRADGSFEITFTTPGRHLVTAEKAGAIRGSQWVTIDEAAEPAPVTPVSQRMINQRRRIAARANCRAKFPARSGRSYRLCVRNANRLGRTLTAKQKRVAARARCVDHHPRRGTSARARCVRAANRIGRR